MTNCSDLKLSSILFCPSRQSQSNTKLPFAVGSALSPEHSVLILVSALILHHLMLLLDP